MYLLVIFLPLLGAIISGFFGRFLGRSGVVFITISCMCLTTISAFVCFYEVGFCGCPCYIILFNWVHGEDFSISWGFMFDSLTISMLLIITIISTLVHIYSSEYMNNDPHMIRFMSYLSLFTFFMLILVTADNTLQMFMGWEGVGLCSYLSINFWYTRFQANVSAIKAILINRIGDFGFLIASLFIVYYFGSLDFDVIFLLAPYYEGKSIEFFGIYCNILTLICIFLFIGAVGKSAQIGLHTWLPDAMEGPTPVSALIHAATMVTAGIFLIIRCSPFFEYSDVSLTLLILFGAMTAFFSAMTGLFQQDLKRVIAYSTCSQLGYMIIACGLSEYTVSIFHLVNHAFFKALLFSSAGCIIHTIGGEQDMRKMGGLINVLPYTYTLMLIGSLALLGIPFLTGFYSKDLIIEVASVEYQISNYFVFWCESFTLFFSAMYSGRLLYITFMVPVKSYKLIIKNLHFSGFKMLFSLTILGLGSIFFGFLCKDLFVGFGSDFYGNAIFIKADHNLITISEFVPVNIKLLPLLFTISGLVCSFIFESILFKNQIIINLYRNLQKINWFFNKRWYFDFVYNYFIIDYLIKFSHIITYKLFDRGYIEFFGPYGITLFIYKSSLFIIKLQSGLIYDYIKILCINIMIYLFFIINF